MQVLQEDTCRASRGESVVPSPEPLPESSNILHLHRSLDADMEQQLENRREPRRSRFITGAHEHGDSSCSVREGCSGDCSGAEGE